MNTRNKETSTTTRISAAPPAPMTRRAFLQRLGLFGGGLIVYGRFRDILVDPFAQARTRRGNVPEDWNAFIHIGTENRVTCYVGKIEMGQGPVTSFAQMVAEELDVAYDAVDMVMGDTDLCPWDAGTWGSLSTRYYGAFVKEAACEARGVLKELAAQKLKCPKIRIAAKDGVLYDQTNPGNRVTYGQLTEGKTIEKHLSILPPFKPISEYTISGKPHLRRDSYGKVTGKAQFAGDIVLPGMLYAKILRPPTHAARQTSVDTTAAEKIPGIRIVRDNGMIAVLHPDMDMAHEALDAIKARYDIPSTGIDDKNIFDHLLKNAPHPSIASQGGDLATGEKASQSVIEATYFNSYVAHAPMEPHTAVAAVESKKITVWASTQSPFGVQRQVAGDLDWPLENVRVITPFVGGGFGGKSASRQAIEAARLAKVTGKPVKVLWSREEEFFYDTFRPAAVVKIRSGIDPSGKMAFWDYKVYFAGQRGCENFYEIPHHREAVYGEWRGGSGVHPFAVGPWRAPAANTNTYARDLHINLMAAKAGQDPLQFRLAHLKDKRMRSVLEAAARQFNWKPAKPPSGRGLGIACGIDAETYVALMAEVKVHATGAVDVKRVVCAQDMGQVVNPQGAIIQMEGCITMGLGYALAEEVHFSDGQVLDTNFDSYQIPKFSWLPDIDTVIVPNDALPPKGGGEPAIIGMGGVLATAVHDATGAAVFQLPMTQERVKAAMAASARG